MLFIPIVPDAPEDFVVSAENSTTLSATWNEPNDANGVLLAYRLTVHVLTDYLGPEYSEYNETFRVPFPQRSLVISGLHPFARYTFELRARTSVGIGSATTAMGETFEDGESVSATQTLCRLQVNSKLCCVGNSMVVFNVHCACACSSYAYCVNSNVRLVQSCVVSVVMQHLLWQYMKGFSCPVALQL